MKKLFKIIIIFIILIILALGIMFAFKICPPQGPWIMPPWCKINQVDKNLKVDQEATTFNKKNSQQIIDDSANPSDNLKQKTTVEENFKKIVKPNFQKGVVFGAMKWSADEKKYINQSINVLNEFNVEWIAVVPEWFVFPDVTGTEIKPFYTDSGNFPNTTGWVTPTLKDDELINIIHQAKKKGIKVVLKPHLDPINFGMVSGASRGSFKPNDWEKWFTNYEKFILHYAQLAAQQKVDMLIIGTELDTAVREAPQATQKWKKIISQVRQIYSGPLTYSASCYGECWSPRQVGFWDDLDYIGFEPYFSLTHKNNPTVAEMKLAFNEKFTQYAKPLYNRYHKPIIITEANVYSYTGVNQHPIDPPPSNAIANPQEQANYYEAFFQSIKDKDWIKGVYWWGWYLATTMPNASYSNDLYDPFVRKPAGQVLKKWYQIITTH